jgi:predicted phage-related endonuclease
MTAKVVLPAEASREEWLAARRLGIGGSDIGALLGASPWSTPLDVWADKTGQAEPHRRTTP